MKRLILGGVRSGKTRLAQSLAAASGLDVLVIATARGDDAEMHTRIAHHRADRPAHWIVIEEPITLAAALLRESALRRCVIVDCLTLWITNLLMHDDAQGWQQERQSLIDALPSLPGETILVSNETGMGIVPLGELTRRYCDEAGWLHQSLAACCDEVTLVVAGLSLPLKKKAV